MGWSRQQVTYYKNIKERLHKTAWNTAKGVTKIKDIVTPDLDLIVTPDVTIVTSPDWNEPHFRAIFPHLSLNGKRNDLTVLEQAEHIQERERLIEAKGLRAKAHRPNKGEMISPLKTTKQIAEEMGLSERSYQQRKQIADKIPEAVKDEIRNTEIADVVGIDRTVISEKISTFGEKVPGNQNAKSHENDDSFTTPIYNVWKYAKKTNGGIPHTRPWVTFEMSSFDKFCCRIPPPLFLR